MRDYDPASGRWTARDPTLFDGGQGNLYVYAGNDPVGLVDRSGFCAYKWYKPWTWSPRAQKSAQAVGDFLLGGAMLVVGTGEEVGGGAFALVTAGGGAPVTVVAVCQGAGLQVAGAGFMWKGVLGAQQAVQMSGSSDGAVYKVKRSGLTGKEAASDAPSWAKDYRPEVDQDGKDFARKLLDEKYGQGNWNTGPGSEFDQIKKWANRAFENPTP